MPELRPRACELTVVSRVDIRYTFVLSTATSGCISWRLEASATLCLPEIFTIDYSSILRRVRRWVHPDECSRCLFRTA
jgi:hypothetical protein